jgi:hypothetical protein
MGCYTIVLGAALCMQGLRARIQNRIPHANVLSLLLWGGAIALVVDHLMNGELFLLSSNLLWDLFVGIGMTVAIFVIWGAYVVVKRALRKEHRIEA